MREITDYQKYIAKSKYARWDKELGRREDWEETVDRYFDYWQGHYPWLEEDPDFELAREAKKNMEVMGSMRAVASAGVALDRDNIAGYNCSFVALGDHTKQITIEHDELDEPLKIGVTSPIAWDEAMYVLLCGTGVGFSVERQFINNLPKVGKKLNRRVYQRNNKNYPGVDKAELSHFDRNNNTIRVADSKYGWASSVRILIVELYNGNFDIKWDTTAVRPAGSLLKTFGGRSSGPGPLEELFEFTIQVFKDSNGRKLSSIECHDVMCKIADIVVVGGVRRSALISLSNLTDERMRHAKSGAWWEKDIQRRLANNSVCYTEKPDIGVFMREWEALYESKSGERGIFSREASKLVAARNGRRDPNYDFGTNPCSEIILRSKQLCNLSEVVVRTEDTFEDLKRKVELATILGTLQATRTNFVYLSEGWAKNTVEEALLGVSLTGIMDHPVLNGSYGRFLDLKIHEYTLEDVLHALKEVAIETNKVWAKKLGINPATAITCVKPSGTVSQLVDSASGIHPRHNPHYIRTVRADKKDPMYQFMLDQGVPCEDEFGKENASGVFSFPMKAPEGSVFRDDRNAIEQLELWKIYAEHWCEHKPSITVYVKEHEWLGVGSWVYDNFDIVSGVSFLPHDGGSYKQAPYQDISKETYEDLVSNVSPIKWEDLPRYEEEDHTEAAQTLACAGGVCEV